MSSTISPRKSRSGLQNFVSVNAPNSDLRSSRDAIKDELVGKLQFDVSSVFDCLGVDEVPERLVEACVASLSRDVEVQKAKARLMELASTNVEEIQKMYPPLVCSRHTFFIVVLHLTIFVVACSQSYFATLSSFLSRMLTGNLTVSSFPLILQH